MWREKSILCPICQSVIEKVEIPAEEEQIKPTVEAPRASKQKKQRARAEKQQWGNPIVLAPSIAEAEVEHYNEDEDWYDEDYDYDLDLDYFSYKNTYDCDDDPRYMRSVNCDFNLKSKSGMKTKFIHR